MTELLPQVFIGSSAEGLDVAREVELQIEHDALTTIWKDGVFGLGSGTLESLMIALGGFDFAVMVLSPDDLLESRNARYASPRDNVIFELGLFMGRLGRNRTFIVHEKGISLKLPSDLDGITVSPYRKRENLSAALSPTCTPIIKVIRDLGRLEVPPDKQPNRSQAPTRGGSANRVQAQESTDSGFFIQPTDDRVIAKLRWPRPEIRGGITIPKTAMERPIQGTVVAIGDTVQRIRVGNEIMWGKYSGFDMILDEEDYIMLRENDVIGVIG